MLKSNSLTSQYDKHTRRNTLVSGDSLNSHNGKYALKLHNCNLKLFKRTKTGKQIHLWSSNTAGKGENCRSKMQNSGNFSILSGERVVWSTLTSGTNSGPYKIVLRNSGNFILLNRNRRCLWATRGCPAHERARIKYNPTIKRNFQRRLNRLIKTLKKPIFSALNRATEKPRIKNRKPVGYVPPKRERKAGPRAHINKRKRNLIRRNLNNFGRLKGNLRRTGLRLSRREWSRLRNKTGEGFDAFMRHLMNLGRRKARDMRRRINRRTRRHGGRRRRYPKYRGKRAFIKLIRLQGWVHILKKWFHKRKSHKRWRRIRRFLKRKRHFRGSKRLWRRMRRAYNARNWKKFFRLVTRSPVPNIRRRTRHRRKGHKPAYRPLARPNPTKPKPTHIPENKPVPRPKPIRRKVQRGHWVSEYRWDLIWRWRYRHHWYLQTYYYLTWYWQIFWWGHWHRHCWWWWCWWHFRWGVGWYQRWYWAYWQRWEFQGRWQWSAQWEYRHHWKYQVSEEYVDDNKRDHLLN